jgi:hypothetical protein
LAHNGVVLAVLILRVCTSGPNMDKAAAYAISALIVGFGAWILVAGLSSNAPAFWACVALIPISIGVWSAFCDT